MKKKEDPFRDVHLEENFEKMIEEGIGQGVLEDYIPWTNHYKFSSKGRNILTKGTKIKRFFDLFSDHERDYYFLLEYSPEVYDIREQFPLLDRTHSQRIARKLCVKHPICPFSHTPNVMTTDFYIVMKGGEIRVRTIKEKEELKKRRVQEKFAIEQEYFKDLGINNWKIITEDEINCVKARNISLFRKFTDLKRDIFYFNYSEELIRDEIDCFINIVTIENRAPIEKIVEIFDSTRRAGAGYSIFKHLLANHKIVIDLNQPLNYSKSIYLKEGEIIVD